MKGIVVRSKCIFAKKELQIASDSATKLQTK
jgi:hypothetical protein